LLAGDRNSVVIGRRRLKFFQFNERRAIRLSVHREWTDRGKVAETGLRAVVEKEPVVRFSAQPNYGSIGSHIAGNIA
jgi:hypothetical protein